MKKLLPLAVAMFVVVALHTAAEEPRPAAPRDADAILKEYRAIKLPSFDPSKQHDAAYIRSYVAERDKAVKKRQALALEFYESHPEHPDAPRMLNERWQSMAPGVQAAQVMKETDEFLKSHADSPNKADAMYWHAIARNYATHDPAGALPAAEQFITANPTDPRGAELLYAAARAARPAQQKDLYARIARDYPDSPYGQEAAGESRKADSVGKPFVLAFTDAISGQQISMDKLRGKVVVVDFWATWCGPCVAEMPKMKQLYADFKPKGVEFIGVSLDQPQDKGGLTSLKAFVKKNGITWPQYYQGNFWQSEFSSSWGIHAIPCVFVVDHNGNLYSTEARGRLEKLLPELLAKRDGNQLRAE